MSPLIQFTAEVEEGTANTRLVIEENLADGQYIIEAQGGTGDRSGTYTNNLITAPTISTRSIQFDFSFKKAGGDGRHNMGFVNTLTGKRVGYINTSEAYLKNEVTGWEDDGSSVSASNNNARWSCYYNGDKTGYIRLTHDFENDTSTMELDYDGRATRLHGTIDCTGWDWSNTCLFFHSSNGTFYVWDIVATIKEDNVIIDTIPYGGIFDDVTNWDAQPTLSSGRLYLSSGKNSKYVASTIEDFIASTE